MPAKFSFGKMEFDFSLGRSAAQSAREEDRPFRLAVIGDFSGRASQGIVEPLVQRHVRRIDCDNCEQVMLKMGVALRLAGLPSLGESFELRFDSLDDLHPDRILIRVKPLADLVAARKRLLNPSTASAAAQELERLLAGAAKPSESASPDMGLAESSDQTLARLLGTPKAAPPTTKAAPGGIDIQGLIRQIAAPSAVPAPVPQHTALLSAVDLELTNRLRSILHQPAFQVLEAAWRGIDRLVREFGGEEKLEICLIDVSKEELVADLRSSEDLTQCGIWKTLRDAASENPWALLIGHYTFADTQDDIESLGRLGGIAAATQAPFIAAASPQLVGCDSFAQHPDPDDWRSRGSAESRQAWQALRALPAASYLGLALPRFLLRQPYGKDGDPIEVFPFEELVADIPHESYLWGNPAIACGSVLADAFRAGGWGMQARGYAEMGDVPVHRFKQEGENRVKPCAEAWLTERAGAAIEAQGLIPVLSIKGRDAVRLANLQSVKSPSAALAGRWG